MKRVKYIIVHNNGVAGRTIDNIRRTHMAKGWKDVGYHYVIHEDGTIHAGRPEHQQGAHRSGLNAVALGVCCIGNGNRADFNAAQHAALTTLLRSLLDKYGLTTAAIYGHRESNALVGPDAATTKTCPGTKVSMPAIRERLGGPPLVA